MQRSPSNPKTNIPSLEPSRTDY